MTNMYSNLEKLAYQRQLIGAGLGAVAGGGAGYLGASRGEDETEQDFRSRRLRNTLIGSAVGGALGAGAGHMSRREAPRSVTPSAAPVESAKHAPAELDAALKSDMRALKSQIGRAQENALRSPSQMTSEDIRSLDRFMGVSTSAPAPAQAAHSVSAPLSDFERQRRAHPGLTRKQYERMRHADAAHTPPAHEFAENLTASAAARKEVERLKAEKKHVPGQLLRDAGYVADSFEALQMGQKRFRRAGLHGWLHWKGAPEYGKARPPSLKGFDIDQLVSLTKPGETPRIRAAARVRLLDRIESARSDDLGTLQRIYENRVHPRRLRSAAERKYDEIVARGGASSNPFEYPG